MKMRNSTILIAAMLVPQLTTADENPSGTVLAIATMQGQQVLLTDESCQDMNLAWGGHFGGGGSTASCALA